MEQQPSGSPGAGHGTAAQRSVTPDFTPRKATHWLSPGLLASAAKYATISKTFGQYQDKREAMGALPADEPLGLRDRDELWLDYVSDTGDGFDATYAIASLVGREELEVPGARDPRRGDVLPRGELLVLGGDQCYPRGEMEEYQDRFVGPYRTAFPGEADQPWTWMLPDHCQEQEGSGQEAGEGNGSSGGHEVVADPSTDATMLALPGNHDWYDGLTAFTRTFCQQRRIGGWRTRQSRSYFAVSLPGRWWLWAIDIQFDTYIDVVQHRWLAEMSMRLCPGDGIILCIAKPAWTSLHEDEDAYRTISFVERTFVEPRGAEVRMVLSGDKHHYSRYGAKDGRQLVTAGGGGAYLTSTHHLPDHARVPSSGGPGATSDATEFALRDRRFPDRTTSEELGKKRLGTPVVRSLFRLTPWLAVLVGALHALPALGMLWMLGAGPDRLVDRLESSAGALSGLGWLDTLTLLVASPGTLLLAGVVVAATVGLTKAGGYPVGKRWGARALGAAHGVVHLAIVVTSTCLAAQLAGSLFGETCWWLALPLALVVVLVAGALLGTALLGVYLCLADTVDINSNELFAALAHADHKNFLRIHVTTEKVTVYPIGLERVPRWREHRAAAGSVPRWVPDGDMKPHLIEQEPFVVTLRTPASGATRG